MFPLRSTGVGRRMDDPDGVFYGLPQVIERSGAIRDASGFWLPPLSGVTLVVPASISGESPREITIRYTVLSVEQGLWVPWPSE